MTFRLGIIGAGSVTATYHLPVLLRMPQIELGWIVDVAEPRARELARAFSIPEVGTDASSSSDVSGVLIATPLGTRDALMATVIRRGWHAFCEKPMAPTGAQHRRMLEHARSKNVHVGVGLVRRFYVATQRARSLVSSCLLGSVREVLAGEGLRARKFGRGGDWYQSRQDAGGGVFFETGSHLVDQVFAITGSRRFELEECRRTMVNGLEMDTRALAKIEIDGRWVPFRVGVSRLEDIYNGIVVRCDNGEIRLGLDGAACVELRNRRGEKVGEIAGYPDPKTAIYAAVRGEWDDFVSRCSSPPHDPWDTGLVTTDFLDACATFTAESLTRTEAGE